MRLIKRDNWNMYVNRSGRSAALVDTSGTGPREPTMEEDGKVYYDGRGRLSPPSAP
jgi:hypothetical protein